MRENIRSEKRTKKNYSIFDYLKFIIPSTIGALMLMIPFQYQGETIIAVALLASGFTALLSKALPLIILLFITFTAGLTVLYKLRKPNWIEKNVFLKDVSQAA